MADIQQQIDAITAKYASRIENLKRRGEKLRDDTEKPEVYEAIINVDFDVTMKRVDISFDLPEVRVNERHIAIDIPEVFPERQTIVFHRPAIRMKRVVIGKKPVIRGWKVEWEDIIIEVPEPYMKEERIVFDTPSVRMKRQDWYIRIPEFTMKRMDWSLDLPQITIREVKGQIEKAEREGRALQMEGEQIAAEIQVEIANLLGSFAAGSQAETSTVATQSTAQFDLAIGQLERAINELVAKGVDPIKIPTEAGGTINLRKQLDDLIAQRADALAQIQAAQN